MSLYPTKTRLALLQAVADGAVAEHYYPLLPAGPYSLWDLGPGNSPRWRKVNAAVNDLRLAGWIRDGEQEYPGQYRSPRRWEITALGREVLEAGGGEA